MSALRAGYVEVYGNPYLDLPTIAGFSGRTVTTHVIKLGRNVVELRARYSALQRRGLRGCDTAGVTVRAAESREDWVAYFRCYQESLARWADKTTSHYPWELFDRLRQEPVEHVALWLAEARGKILAGAIVFLLGKNAYYWHGATGADVGKLMPSRKLWDQIFQRYCADGLHAVDMLSSGGHEGVARFKESLGALPLTFQAYSWRAGILRRVLMKIARATAGIYQS